MTGEVIGSQNHRKFIPVLCSGSLREAAPSWLASKYYINLTGNPYSERDYEELCWEFVKRLIAEPFLLNLKRDPCHATF